MRQIVNSDTILLHSHRYWIKGYEYIYSHKQSLSGIRYAYHFSPVGGKRKADLVLSQNQLLKVEYQDTPDLEANPMSARFSVIRRQRSDGITVYATALPWPFVSQFFMFEDASLPPEERANRSLDPRHAKKIKEYLLKTPNYYLPPMIASVESKDEKFTPFDKDHGNGLLELPFTAIYKLIDGQHRTFAIQEIMRSKDADKFKSELISVDLITNAGLELRKKIFREVNSLSKSVSRNLTTVYLDSPIAVFANSVLATVPLFDHQFVEKEKNSLAVKSVKLLVYKHLYDATINMKPAMGDEVDFKFCQNFWQILVDTIPQWREVLDGDRTPQSVRESTVAAHGVTIHALGELGKYLGDTPGLAKDATKLKITLTKLAAINWDKTNPDWLHRVVGVDGAMLSKRHNVKLMLNYFKVKIGVPIKCFNQQDKDLELLHLRRDIAQQND